MSKNPQKPVPFLYVSLKKNLRMAQAATHANEHTSFKRRQRTWKTAEWLLPFTIRKKFPMDTKEYSYFTLLCVVTACPAHLTQARSTRPRHFFTHLSGKLFVPFRPNPAPLQRGISQISSCI